MVVSLIVIAREESVQYDLATTCSIAAVSVGQRLGKTSRVTTQIMHEMWQDVINRNFCI